MRRVPKTASLMPLRRPSPVRRRAAALALTLAAAAPALAQDDLQARNLAATCSGCHGTEGRGGGAMSALAGVPAERLLARLNAFRSGAEPATVMHQITRGYSQAQLALIAAYFAARPARP